MQEIPSNQSDQKLDQKIDQRKKGESNNWQPPLKKNGHNRFSSFLKYLNCSGSNVNSWNLQISAELQNDCRPLAQKTHTRKVKVDGFWLQYPPFGTMSTKPLCTCREQSAQKCEKKDAVWHVQAPRPHLCSFPTTPSWWWGCQNF